MRTMEDLVRRAAAAMEAAQLHFGHGTDNAWDEACWMAAAALELPVDFDDARFSQPVGDDQYRRFRALLDERITSRRPLAYLLGEAWFAGLPFEVNEHVLIPRSPIAELIVEGFTPWSDAARMATAADVGTGSGCLAVALAAHWPRLAVDAYDISPAALAVAGRNARRHAVQDRVTLRQSDLLAAADGRRYDLIVSNPPYVPARSMQALPFEYRHEPAMALHADDDGLALVLRLLRQAPDHLADGGLLVVEVGEAQSALQRRLPDAPLTWVSFAAGGEGVFVLDAAGCRQTAAMLEAVSSTQ